MTDQGCIDHPRCDEYDRLIKQFDGMGDWFGPQYQDWREDHVRLRNWWDRHGCVRCLLVAKRKRDAKQWDRDCRETADGSGDYKMGNPGVVDALRKAIKNWTTTSNRLPGRYFCADHTVSLSCGALLNDRFILLDEAGHTGWIYAIPPVWRAEFSDRCWMVGEETVAADVNPIFAGDQNAVGDTNAITELEAFVKMSQWQKWKRMWSHDGNFEEAYLVSMAVRAALFGPANNCNTAAAAVLRGFGSDSLPAEYGYVVGDFFGAITVPAIDLWPEPDPTIDDPVPTPTPAPAPGRTPRPKASPAPVSKPTPRLARAAEALLAANGRIVIDGKALKLPNVAAAVDRLAVLSKALVKDVTGKMTQAAKEATQRRAMNASPLVAEHDEMAVTPVLDVDTKVEWVSIDWC